MTDTKPIENIQDIAIDDVDAHTFTHAQIRWLVQQTQKSQSYLDALDALHEGKANLTDIAGWLERTEDEWREAAARPLPEKVGT